MQLTAQINLDADLQFRIYQAYISNNLALWESGIQELEAIYKDQASDETLLELGRLEYGCVSICMGNDAEDKAKKHLAKAEKHLAAYLKKNKDSAEAHALMSGVLGFKIAFSPLSGMWLGPRSNRHLKKGMSYDDHCAMVWHQKGSSLLHTPASFGGDVKESITHFAKAAELQEASYQLENNWEYLEALVWLGQAYYKNGQIEEARMTYEKALQVEPNFGWVKYRLLPQANKAD